MKYQKPQLFQELTPRLLRIFLFSSLGAMNFGYDNNWWSSAITLPAFISDFGRDGAIPSNWLSAASGTPIAGWIIGCMVAGSLTSNFGRKITIVVLCLVALVGMVIQAATNNFWALMVGRFVNSLSMGIEANCVPMYMAELAPASIRGALVNFYQSWLYVGAVLAASTVYGASVHLTGRWTYKTVIVAQLGLPCLLLSAVWFLPESPRWLLSRGRRDESLKALKYLRHGAATDDDISTELELMDQAMQLEKEQHLATSYIDCFRASNGIRTLVAVGVQVLQQAQGNAFLASYKVIFFQQLGINQPLVIQVASLCCGLVGTFMSFYLSDKLGRRVMLIGGAFLMALLMWIISGMAAWLPGGVHGAAASGCVAAIMINGAISAATWGSVMWAVTAEVATSQLRERTIAVATTIGFVVSLTITYVNPFIQNEPGNLGARIGMVYGSVSIIAMAFVWFFVPEMKGRSLEELDELFHSGIPAWRSKSFISTGIGSRITNIENVHPDGKHPVIDDVAVEADDDTTSHAKMAKMSNEEV